jgi:hypothetical protein
VAIEVEGGLQQQLVLPMDVASVFDSGIQMDAAALMLDPGLSFLDTKVDSFKSQELRPALEALRRGAERAGMAVPMLCHFNKTQGTDVLSKIAGSRAFAEVARAALAVAVDKDEDPDADDDGQEEQVILSQAKNNLGRANLSNLTYQIVDTAVSTPEGDAHVGRLVWTGETGRTAEQALNGEQGRKKAAAGSAVYDWVVAQGRPVKTEEVIAAFEEIPRLTVRKQLSRLAERGQLYKPVYGHYAKALDSASTINPLPDLSQLSHRSHHESGREGVTDTHPPRLTGHSGHIVTPPPVSQFNTSVTEREKCDNVTEVTGDNGELGSSHPPQTQQRVVSGRLLAPQAPDEPAESWLVHGDPYRS